MAAKGRLRNLSQQAAGMAARAYRGASAVPDVSAIDPVAADELSNREGASKKEALAGR
jgi:hypothetical protein